jgi:hypothetical protein
MLNAIGEKLKWIYFDGNPLDDDSIDILKDYIYKNPFYPFISLSGSHSFVLLPLVTKIENQELVDKIWRESEFFTIIFKHFRFKISEFKDVSFKIK